MAGNHKKSTPIPATIPATQRQPIREQTHDSRPGRIEKRDKIMPLQELPPPPPRPKR